MNQEGSEADENIKEEAEEEAEEEVEVISTRAHLRVNTEINNISDKLKQTSLHVHDS